MDIPSGWSDLIGFLIFIAPGLSFEAVWAHRRPSAKLSAFQEITRTVAASVASWAIVGLVASAPLARWRGWLDPVLEFATDPAAALSQEDGTQALLSILLSALAVGAAIAVPAGAAWLMTKRGATTNRAGSAVWTVLRLRIPKGGRPFVWVEMSDGRAIGGFYAAGDLRPGVEGTGDLALERPLHERTDDGTVISLDPAQFVVVPGDDIRLMSVTVLPENHS